MLIIVKDEHKIKPSTEGKILRDNRQLSKRDTIIAF